MAAFDNITQQVATVFFGLDTSVAEIDGRLSVASYCLAETSLFLTKTFQIG